MDSYQTRAQPLCRAILGPSGAGKSTVSNYFRKAHPPIEHDGFTEYPVLVFSTPPQVTLRSFAAEFLQALEDPYPSRGSAADLGRRIDTALSAQEGGHRVRVVVVNECQRFAESRWVHLYDSANFLRERIEKTGSSFVLVGLDSGSELIDQNEQLSRIFQETITMHPFIWENAADRSDFRGVLKSLKTELAPRYDLPSDFTDLDRAFHLYYASAGIIGILMPIIRGAATIARNKRSRVINWDMISESYIANVRGKDHRIPNPFTSRNFVPEQAPPLVSPQVIAAEKRAHAAKRQRSPRRSAREILAA
jgi:hypothetical protein